MKFNDIMENIKKIDFPKILSIISIVSIFGSGFIYGITYVYLTRIFDYFDIPNRFLQIDTILLIPLFLVSVGLGFLIFILKDYFLKQYDEDLKKTKNRLLRFGAFVFKWFVLLCIYFSFLSMFFNLLSNFAENQNEGLQIALLIIIFSISSGPIILLVKSKISIKILTLCVIVISFVTFFWFKYQNNTQWKKNFEIINEGNSQYVIMTTYNNDYFTYQCEQKGSSIKIDTRNYRLIAIDNVVVNKIFFKDGLTFEN
jgi:hypothetical protein